MCCYSWAFADAWLDDPVDEATKRAQSAVSTKYTPAKFTNAVNVSQNAVSQELHGNNEWQYKPTAGISGSMLQVSIAPSILVSNAGSEP